MSFYHDTFYVIILKYGYFDQKKLDKKLHCDDTITDNNASSVSSSNEQYSSTSQSSDYTSTEEELSEESFVLKHSTMESELKDMCTKFEKLGEEFEFETLLLEEEKMKEIKKEREYYNPFTKLEITTYLNNMKKDKSLTDESLEIIENLLKERSGDEEIYEPSLLLNTRQLLRCIKNLCYLNKAFNIKLLVDIIFEQIYIVCDVTYHSKMKELKDYLISTYFGYKPMFTNWYVFNLEDTTNNIA